MKKRVINRRGKIIFSLIGISVIVLVIVLIMNFIKKDENANESQSQETQNTTNEILKHAIILEDGTKLNTSEELKEIKKYKELEISNIQFTSKDGNSVLLAHVKNIGQEEHKSEIVKIIILDDNNEVITEISSVIADVKPGEIIKLNSIITADVVDAKDIKIEEKVD